MKNYFRITTYSPEENVSLWSGHKADNSITTNVYTHFQEHSELQMLEMQKYNYD